MPFKKLLILGLDALPWRILKPMMDAGAAPRLRALVERGCSGVLRSTMPHQTPAAWTTFMTGVHPGTHGIVNWQHYDAKKNALTLNNVERYAGKTIYERFSDAGFKVGVVMQPLTYPPFKVNGFLLTGFDSPGIKEPFAYPRELEKEVLEICPRHGENLGLEEQWEGASLDAGDEAFFKNIELLRERVKRVANLALELNRRHPTDVLMVYFQDPDLLLHRAWRWCDPATWHDNDARRNAVLEFFKTLDSACGELIDACGAGFQPASLNQCLTLVLSDHGQRPDALRVRLNSILIELGFLVPASGFNKLKESVRKLTGKLKNSDEQGFGMPIDWERTRAFMPFQSCTGFVYVNREGRQPNGSVKAADFARVRDDVIAALRNYRDPKTGASYFEEVAAMDEAHGWRSELLLPDIYVQPQPGIEFVRRAKSGEIAHPTKRAYAGLHDPDGLYILDGPGVKSARDIHAHIVDMAPTALAALGQAVPSYMEGRVLNECFEAPYAVQSIPFPWESKEAGDAYSAEGAAAVEKRLADLGYLD